MSYFAIATPDGDETGLSVEQTKAEVLRRWPRALLEVLPEGLYSLRWDAQAAGEWLEGGLYRDGFTLDLDGPIESCAELAVWMKEQLMYEIVFLDHLNEGCVLVAAGSNASELVAAYHREARESAR